MVEPQRAGEADAVAGGELLQFLQAAGAVVRVGVDDGGVRPAERSADGGW